MLQQDSSDETGISHDTPRGNSEIARARDRKANAALQMKVAGAAWDEIAQVLGFPTARAALVATERALEKELQSEDSKKFMRALASKRLERLTRSVWTKAIDPENPEHLQAVDRARQLIDRHAKLQGLDAPTEFVVSSPSAAEIEKWVASVVTHAMPALPEADIFDVEFEEIEAFEPLPEQEVQTLNGDADAVPSE